MYFKKTLRIILRIFFRYDWWHTSPIENRKYVNDIITEVNKHNSRDLLLEIGCGLGDIIGNSKFQNKLFYDTDQNVLNAARFIHKFRKLKSHNEFKVFDFLKHSIKDSRIYDVVVLVNWLHTYDSVTVAPKIKAVVNNNMKKDSLLIFDLIPPTSSNLFNRSAGQFFHHSVGDLIKEKDFDIKILDGYRFDRQIVIAKLRKFIVK